jgi:hypothetical protein
VRVENLPGARLACTSSCMSHVDFGAPRQGDAVQSTEAVVDVVDRFHGTMGTIWERVVSENACRVCLRAAMARTRART